MEARPGDAKLWYWRPTWNTSVWYLRCLLQMEWKKLKIAVPHTASVDVYKALLGIKVKGGREVGLKGRDKNSFKRAFKVKRMISKKSKIAGNLKMPLKHAKSFSWGVCQFTFCRGRVGASGKKYQDAYHVTCPATACQHRSTLSKNTGCTRRRCFTSETEEEAIKKLKSWAAAWAEHDDRVAHQRLQVPELKDIKSHMIKTPAKAPLQAAVVRAAAAPKKGAMIKKAKK